MNLLPYITACKEIKKVSLICTVYNEADNILVFLESIMAGSVLPAEFVIVDGGSTDRTTELVKGFSANHLELNIRLIEGKEKINIAKGRNIGIGLATNEIVAVTDAGCIIDKYWLEEITKLFFADENICIVAGWYEPYIQTDFHRKVAEATVPTLKEINQDTFLPSSRSIAFRKASWAKVGGYPEHLTLCAEDTLFDLKLKDTGCNFVFNSNARVFWRMRDNLRALLKQFYMYGFGEGEARIYTPKYLVRIMILFVPVLMFFTTKKFKHFWLRYLIYWSLVLGWIKGFLKKHA